MTETESDPDERRASIEALLTASRAGDDLARGELVSVLDGELRRLAGSLMRNQPAWHTLQATALVNEASLRLLRVGRIDAETERQFMGLAARAMRCVLVDHARAKRARPGDWEREAAHLDAIVSAHESRSLDLVALDAALERLEGKDPELSRIVELRFFAGQTMPEVATSLQLPLRSVERGWATARSWLADQLQADLGGG